MDNPFLDRPTYVGLTGIELTEASADSCSGTIVINENHQGISFFNRLICVKMNFLNVALHSCRDTGYVSINLGIVCKILTS